MRYFIDDSYDDIISIYSEVFLSSFPKESYNDKLKKGYRILNIKFVENDELVGFCLVLDKSNISTLHCWMGGVLP